MPFHAASVQFFGGDWVPTFPIASEEAGKTAISTLQAQAFGTVRG